MKNIIMLLKQGIINVCRLNQKSKEKYSWSKRNVKQHFKKYHVNYKHTRMMSEGTGREVA